jgi:hypothetical protein
LNVTPGDPSYVTFSTSATTETATWSVTADLQQFSLPSNAIALPISNGPLATGFANVSQGDANGFSKASGGSVVLSFSASADRVVVEVTAEPAAMSARVEAELIVLCWVPRDALASPGEVQNGTTGPGSDEVLVQDVGFATAGCKPFAPRAP